MSVERPRSRVERGEDGRERTARSVRGAAEPAPADACSSTRAGQTTDRLGIAASATCAVHCAATALVPGVLGVLGLGALMGHEAEWAFTLAAALLAVAAMIHGWRARRSVVISLTFAVGVAGLLLSRAVEEGGAHGLGTAMGVFAGSALVVAHVLNIRNARAAASGHSTAERAAAS